MNLFDSTLGLNIPVNGLLPGSTKKETKGKKSFFKMKHIPLSLWWILRATYKCSSIIHGHVQKHSRCYRMLQPAGLTTNPSSPTTCRMEQTGAELSKKALRCCWAAVSGYQRNLSASGVKVVTVFGEASINMKSCWGSSARNVRLFLIGASWKVNRKRL